MILFALRIASQYADPSERNGTPRRINSRKQCKGKTRAYIEGICNGVDCMRVDHPMHHPPPYPSSIDPMTPSPHLSSIDSMHHPPPDMHGDAQGHTTPSMEAPFAAIMPHPDASSCPYVIVSSCPPHRHPHRHPHGHPHYRPTSSSPPRRHPVISSLLVPMPPPHRHPAFASSSRPPPAP